MVYLVDPKQINCSKCRPVCPLDLVKPLYGVPLCRQIEA
jgi:hypothetical protein